MTICDDLRQSVLQAAIQGKLTKQLPEDGTAGDLMASIKAEKEQLIKEKKIKKEKPLAPISEDEIPFDIPDNWEWIHFVDAGYFVRGSGIKRDEVTSSGFPCVRYGEMYTTYKESFYRTVSFTSETVFQKAYKAHFNDVLMALTGENNVDIALARVYLGKQEIAYGGDLTKFTPIMTSGRYVALVVNSAYGIERKSKVAKGNIIVHISNDNLASIPFPLPPLAEQHRIVARVDELMAKIDELEAVEKELVALKKAFPGDMKASLLQAAMQGKLTQQLPEDGSAADLLASIGAEKEQLIKEKKIKKEKPLAPISEDEIPFEIPENWEWVRLGEISSYAYPKRKVNAMKAEPDTWMLDMEDIERGGRLLRKKKVRECKAIGDKTIFEQGNILYSKLRPYLLKILIADEDGICTPELIPFDVFGDINKQFIVYFLNSPYVDTEINRVTYGVKMPRVGTDTMVNFCVPLPPLAEQKRIVEKLDKLLPLCDALKEDGVA